MNCYTCVEINVHSLILLMLYLKENELDRFFRPELLGNQQCEQIFRQIRSMSSIFSTVTNCGLLGITQRISKIELFNDITYNRLKHMKFPRIGRESSSYYWKSKCQSDSNCQVLPSGIEIVTQIEQAKHDAVEYAEYFGIQTSGNLTCQIRETVSIERPVDNTEQPLYSKNDQQYGNMLNHFQNINLREYSVDLNRIKNKYPYVTVNILMLRSIA